MTLGSWIVYKLLRLDDYPGVELAGPIDEKRALTDRVVLLVRLWIITQLALLLLVFGLGAAFGGVYY